MTFIQNLFCLVFVLCINAITSQTYKAAVIEHNPILDDTPLDTILRNLQSYRDILTIAHSNNVEIIVFPEYGLTGISNLEQNLEEFSISVPEPSVNTIPCYDTNYSKVLIDLSCAVNERRIYTVVNLIERAANETNGTIYYNTNVVFDRIGAVIAKYRKINLFNETFLTPGNESVVFRTDFGVSFGLFTSYDILFQTPALDILANLTVFDIVYPTLWYSETPFGAALSKQAGYARSNRVNLLAAGYNDVTLGITGSGIYYHNGSVADTFIAAARVTRTIVSDIPFVSSRTSTPVCEDYISSRSFGGGIGIVPDVNSLSLPNEDLRNFTFTSLSLTNRNSYNETVCSGYYCCNFNISVAANVTASNAYQYKLAAFHGVRQVGTLRVGTRVCALVACTSDDPSSCGNRDTSRSASTSFQSISVSGKFLKTSYPYDEPLTLLSNLEPLYVADYSYCVQVDTDTVSASLTSKRELTGILAFGLYGRVPSIDNREVGQTDSGVSLKASVILVLFIAFVQYFRN